MSENFDITYGIGHITITPENLTVTANDATVSNCTGIIPSHILPLMKFINTNR